MERKSVYVPVNGTFENEDGKFRVVKTMFETCRNCFYQDRTDCLKDSVPCCSGDYRKDRQDVVFKKIN